MAVDVIVGLQRGDEGKGRFVDIAAKDYDIIARFNGGNNAGHTVVLANGDVLKLHLVPSGIAHAGVVNIIGNGTLVNLEKLVEEIASIEAKGITVTLDNLKISSSAHLIIPSHIYDDEIREAGEARQGSTKSGIAQVSAAKALRIGVRAEMLKNDPEGLKTAIYDALMVQKPQRAIAGLPAIDERKIADEYVDSTKHLADFVTDTVVYVNDALRAEKPARVLAEGAQAFLLDIDHGMYPYTTSTSTTSGGVASGLGIAPSFIGKVTGVAKAVQSHVGGGPYITEVTDEAELAKLHGDMTTVDAEYGTTTGRKRRLGYLDLPQIRRANLINGTNEVILSKVDWVPRYGDTIKICVAYEKDGQRIEIAPDSAIAIEQSTPIYESLPAWTDDIQGIRNFGDLPKEAKEYVEFIEKKLDVKVAVLGVGPDPDQIIIR
ncbi:MAG: Adenylosuccinate synthetase [Candidatus Saccharibacteria bacterium]|nr:Adenylosuccinate synthetase [Candidatus Saccharibacteria bacterium]